MRTLKPAAVLLLAALAASGCASGAKKQAAQFKEQNSILASNLTECQSTRDGLETKLNTSNASLAQANSRVKDLSVQLDSAKRAGAAAQSRYLESARAFQSLKAESDKSSQALSQANDQLSVMRASMEKAVADAAAANDRANQQVAELSRQIAMLQARSAEQAVKSPVANARPMPAGKSSASAGEK